MDITIVIDNKKSKHLKSEWGFCAYIENNDKKYLLDTGGSDKYLTNLSKLGNYIETIDYAVLSHSHIDHSGGYKSFFAYNKNASLFLNKNCTEECYVKIGPFKFNVGMPKYIKKYNANRLVFVEGLYQINEGVYIMEHTIKNVRDNLLYRKSNNKLILDDFSHESNLIFETPKGLVILNSCSHTGLDNILEEVYQAFPNKHIHMMIGGLHIAGKKTDYIVGLANRIKKYDIDFIYTGHCTKENGYRILHNELGDKVVQVKCGMKISI